MEWKTPIVMKVLLSKLNIEGFDYQQLLEQKAVEFGDKSISAILIDGKGNILAEIGDPDKKIIPGSAMRSIFAADILEAGDIKFDTYVQGNRIVCSNGEEQIHFQNWKDEPESITFFEAMTEYSSVGLLSAFLSSDQDNMRSILRSQGFDIDIIKTEPEFAAFALGSQIEISLAKLAELYRDSFDGLKDNISANSQYANQAEELRASTVKGIETCITLKSEKPYNHDIQMAGSCGMGEVVEVKDLLSTFVGDIQIEDKYLILAINVISDETEYESVIMSTDLAYFANQFFIECADEIV